jgi:amino-acid N-acetyltransferase
MPITSAAPSDLNAVVALLDTVGLPHEDLTEASLQHFQVLRREQTVCGVVGLEPAGSSALLRSLAVHPSIRGQGYGQALVQKAEAHGHEQNVDSLYLLTTTAADFFTDLGYERIARDGVPDAVAQTEEFNRLCPDTAACMQKSLIPEACGAFGSVISYLSNPCPSDADQPDWP